MTSISLIISAVGLLFTVMAFAVGRLTAAGKRGVVEGEQKAEIKYIKQQVDKLVKSFEDREKFDRMAQSAHHLVMLEHNRLNEHLRLEHGYTSGLYDYPLATFEEMVR